VNALLNNTSGGNNTASGFGALIGNTTGGNNIAEGYEAGLNLTTGSNNIDIGSKGVAAESNVIRIGTKGVQTETFIVGIYNHALTGNVVVVESSGRLGVQAVSAERFKTAIEPMGSNTTKLGQLRPVTFHLKSDLKGALQYGLIAEEVAKVYPELVIRDEKGRIDGVRYDELAPMLLNEMQKQQRAAVNQAVANAAQAVKMAVQDAEIRDLKQHQLRMQQQMAALQALDQGTRAALRRLEVAGELVAKR
jgi:hypothetical protein